MLFNAFLYMTDGHVKEGFAHLGFPDFFRIELAIAKFLGSLVLIIPKLPKLLKHVAYSGFFIVFVSAIVAHLSVNDTPLLPIIFTGILMVSLFLYEKLNKEQQTAAQP
jgi:DoxX-like family